MKSIVVVLSLMFFPVVASAEVDAIKLAEARSEIQEDVAGLSCADFKAGLPEAADNVDFVRSLERNTTEFEVALYALRKMLEKAESCIN